MSLAPTNSPAWTDPRLALHHDQRTRCRDFMAGTDAVQAKGETYLPRLPRETPTSYAVRLPLAEVMGLLSSAVRSAEGLMIAAPPALEDGTSPRLAAVWQDIDGRQTGGSVWCRGVLRSMLLDGWVVAVASAPVAAGTPINRAEEQALGLRPYVTLYRADSVRSVRTERVGAREILTQIVLEEVVTEADGAFGMTSVQQFRVLRRIARGSHESQVFRMNDRGEAIAYGPPELITTDELPVVEFAAEPDQPFGESPPPLSELAHLNRAHYNVLSDRRWSLKQACFPWLVRVGYQDAEQATTMGPTEALDLPIGGSAQWIAPPAEAFAPTQSELAEIERRAASLSLSFVSGESSTAATATATRIDQKGQDASLAALAVSFRDSLNRLGALLSEMLGGEVVRDTYFHVETSFRADVRDPAFLRVMVDAWQAGGLPLDAMLTALKTGTLPDDFDVEQAALEAMAAAAADRQQAADVAQSLGAAPAAGSGVSPQAEVPQ